MKNIRTVIVAATLALTMGLQVVAHAATLPDEQFVISNPLTSDRYTGINLANDNASKNTFSALEAFTATGTSRESSILTRQTCKTIGSPGCEPSKYFQYNAQIGICDSRLTSNCVAKVFAKDQSGKEVVGTFVENFPGETQYSYSGDTSIGLPAGTSPFIVDFPDHPHLGGTKYLIVVWMQGYRGFNETNFTVENFNTGIFAVSKVSGSYTMSRPADPNDARPDHKLAGRQSTAGGFNAVQSTSRRSACVQTTLTECLLPWPMPLDTSFGFSVKLHEKVTGWLHGRLTDAQAEISTLADGDQLLTIEGKPTLVPGIFAWFKKSDYPEPLKRLYSTYSTEQVNSNGMGWPKLGDELSKSDDGLPYSILKEGFGYDEGGFKETLAWIDAVGDKAAYAQTIWAAKSMNNQYQQCMKGVDTLSGIVSTNSTMYIGTPPTFNRIDQSLDYKVVSPHYLPNGTEFKGSYDLVIRSDVARCIYGFSSAPISATISVISSDGTAQVATTVVGERNGWLTLAAKGFTFSAPTLRVKLSQKAVPAPAKVDPAPVAAPKAAAKKTTISCVKGTTVKKVMAVKPSCPAGFKKK